MACVTSAIASLVRPLEASAEARIAYARELLGCSAIEWPMSEMAMA